MQSSPVTRSAVLALIVAGLACAGNKSNDQVGAAQDSASAVAAGTAGNQTESGVTDSTGKSTLGPGAEQTRPDQGQPVTSKGDTLNPGVDSSSTAR